MKPAVIQWNGKQSFSNYARFAWSEKYVKSMEFKEFEVSLGGNGSKYKKKN